MARYLLRKVPSTLLVLFVSSVLIFLLVRLIPGDPATSLAGPDASPEALAALRAEMGLDGPWYLQYLHWLGGVLTLDPGTSYVIGGEISGLVTSALGHTLVLGGSALALAVTIALVLATLESIVDRAGVSAVLTGYKTVGIALPPFVTGVLLIALFAVVIPVLPAGGIPPEGYAARPDITLQYLLLPAVCLALPISSALTRFLSDALKAQLSAPYVTTARALGIPRWRIVLTQALPNALPSWVTVLGLQVGHLLGGAVLAETIFSWPGLGSLIEQAIGGRDYPLVQVLLLVSVTVFVLTQILSDVVHAVIDPRIRLGGGA